uniref:DUF1618 domain-containing protein n=1 Tax=Oryza meridionalis TaxID=40149 RepID=A0A0E0D7V7_9ORYZ
MGRVGSSIKFMSLHFRGCARRGIPKVTVSRLELGNKTWVTEHVLNLKTLWRQPAFLGANLPTDMAAMYPVLSMNEEDHAR